MNRRERLISEITPGEIQEYISSNGWVPATMRSYLVDVRTLFAFALEATSPKTLHLPWTRHERKKSRLALSPRRKLAPPAVKPARLLSTADAQISCLFTQEW